MTQPSPSDVADVVRRLGDPVVGAEQRPERRAGVAELDGHPDLLLDRQAQAAELGGQGVAVQAHLLGLRDQLGRDLVGGVDAGLGGHHLAPDEVPQHIEQLIELGRGHHEPSVGPVPSRCPGGSGRNTVRSRLLRPPDSHVMICPRP
jgi:hypothetical protein